MRKLVVLSNLDTPEFKRWFAGSKAERGGKPIVLYHGTTKEFRKFEATWLGRANDAGYYGWGYYFTEDYGQAKAYGYGKEPIAVFLSLKKPFIVSVKHTADRESFRSLLPAEVKLQYPKQVTQYLLSKGYDGVLVMKGNVINEAIVLEDSWDTSRYDFELKKGIPNVPIAKYANTKIKSATDNEGTYSTTDPDIYK